MVVPRRNRRAVAVVIRALRTGGLLERSDEGICALARASADALDEALAYGEKLYAVSSMMRTHLQIVEALVGRASFNSSGTDSGMDEFLAFMRSPAALGDAPEEFPGETPPWTR
jgi:hypothetical protein